MIYEKFLELGDKIRRHFLQGEQGDGGSNGTDGPKGPPVSEFIWDVF